jgi:hypothetical protein
VVQKISTLNIRQTGTYLYEAIITETGATKTPPTLESALTVTLHDILKHLTTRSLILVFADHVANRKGQSVDPQEGTITDLEQQATFELAQLGIATQVKRRERHLLFELSRSLIRKQATWPDEHAGRLFESYYINDERPVQLDTGLKEVRDNRKVATHE